MSTLYLLQYNNYYNRIVKYYDTLNDYLTNIPASRRYTLTNINFFYNDNVNTVQTINYKVPEQIPEGYFDYLLVDNDNYGLSRWFIIECKWNRQGQQILTLRRDLVVDFLDTFRSQPLFVEKGNVSSTSDNFIYNGESISFNRVLTGYKYLGSGSGYIVGYISKSCGSNIDIMPDNISIVATREEIPAVSASTSGTIYRNLRFSGSVYAIDTSLPFSPGDARPSGNLYYDRIVNSGSSGSNDIAAGTGNTSSIGGYHLESSNLNQAIHSFLVDNSNEVINGTVQILANHVRDNHNFTPYEKFSYLHDNHELYYVASERKFYEISISISSSYTNGGPVPSGYESDVNQYICDKWVTRYNTSDYFAFDLANGDMNSCPLKSPTYTYQKATVNISDVTSTYHIGTLPSYNNRAHTPEPYDVFVAPYTSTTMKAASLIANTLSGSGALYDLQRVPWVPTYSTEDSNKWTVQGATFYWLTTCDINKTEIIGISGIPYTPPDSIINFKQASQTLTWRFISPNHANAWDFNPVQNGGVAHIYYECTLKPYQPYIHVWPEFGRLYGINYDYDNRGLVCQGSFSLAVSSNAWATYQIQNSAYQDAFNRQIENLSINNRYQALMEKVAIVPNAIQAALSGATAGGMMSGGNVGVSVGTGIVAGISSLAGGLADVQFNDKLRNEALDYTQDQFGYSLQNIIAQPSTLAKSTTFDVNNSVYPVIEIYDATDIEKTAFKNKIKYNGMTIMRIGTFSEYFTNASSDVRYIKGKLIRTDKYDDTHIFNELANELYKGVFTE